MAYLIRNELYPSIWMDVVQNTFAAAAAPTEGQWPALL
jgi:hypothetical protein